jgi:hypothetical protein
MLQPWARLRAHGCVLSIRDVSVRAQIFARRGALAAALAVALAGCQPEVHEGEQLRVDSGAAGGTLNRENTQAGINSSIAPPGQGSALSDTAAGRLPSAGVSGPTQGLSAAAPGPQNANAQTKAQTADTSAAGRAGGAASTAVPKADATPPRTP